MTYATIAKYGAYSRAVDVLAKKSAELIPKILSGQTKISQDNLIELSKLPAPELKRLGTQLVRNDRNFARYAAMRKDLEGHHRKPKENPAVSSEISIKDMPACDPDAEISSLVLTIPSWISSIKRTQGTTSLNLVSEKAKDKLSAMLNNLKTASDQLLDRIGR